MPLMFEVTKQYAKGNAQIRAQFVDEKDAQEFLAMQVNRDHQTRVDTTYHLYDPNGDLLLEVNSLKKSPMQQESRGGTGTGARASITPFANAPRPPGSILPGKQNFTDEDA